MMAKSRPIGSVRYDNSGRVALVSGGTGGIGKAICEAFHDSGASVICLDVNRDAAKNLPEEILFLEADVSSEEACRQAVEQVVENFGGIDVLVNNAAIQPKESYRPLHELDGDVWRRMVDINLTGYTLLARFVVPVMLRQQAGVIVNMASAQAKQTAREVPAYGPLKAANLLQARQWGVEYARDGIRVVSVSPGTINTPMVRATLEEQGGKKELANRHPLGRIGEPEEVAAAVLWLASPAASFVTATDLEVDGGLAAFGAFAEPFPMESD